MRGSPGVQPFGFFATVEGLGGDGLVPVRDLGERIFPLRRGGAGAGRRDERRDRSRQGQRLELQLAEANPVSGALRFELPEGKFGGGGGGRKANGPRRDRMTTARRGRPANIRHQGKRR